MLAKFHVDRELLGYLTQTGENAYRLAQQFAHARTRDARGASPQEYGRLALLIRSCIDTVLPELAKGRPVRLTPDERNLLAYLGRWARHHSSRPVKSKLQAFAKNVLRLPENAKAC